MRAVLLLFPITAASEAAKASQEARIASQGQQARPRCSAALRETGPCRPLQRIARCSRAPLRACGCNAHARCCVAQVSDKVWFTKQTVGNACGTIGLLHAAANLASEAPPAAGSWLEGFLARTAGMDSAARAQALESDYSLDAAHAAAASEGQSAAPADEEEVNLQFGAFVHVDGGLYELDGRKPAPVRHGNTDASSLLADAVAVVQREFVAHADGNVNFNIVALAPPMDD